MTTYELWQAWLVVNDWEREVCSEPTPYRPPFAPDMALIGSSYYNRRRVQIERQRRRPSGDEMSYVGMSARCSESVCS